MDYYKQHVETALRASRSEQRLVIPVEALRWLTRHDDLMADWLFEMLTELFAKKPKKRRKKT